MILYFHPLHLLAVDMVALFLMVLGPAVLAAAVEQITVRPLLVGLATLRLFHPRKEIMAGLVTPAAAQIQLAAAVEPIQLVQLAQHLVELVEQVEQVEQVQHLQSAAAA